MWTRNYNNLLNTVVTNVSEGYNGVSPHPFGDSYAGNFKNALGNVYEISTYNPYLSGSNGGWFTRAPFVYRSGGTNLSAGVTLLTDVQTGLNYENGQQKGKLFVAFGKSDDEEDFDDYRLEDVITEFILNSGTSTVTENNDGTLTISYRLMFTATADFTVREIGLFLPMAYFGLNSGSAVYSYYALINRIVLDEPISAVTDEVVHVNFSITTPKISVA